MRVDLDEESHCIYKHLTCSSCNLFEDISKEERKMSNEENGNLEDDEIGHNFHKAFGWMVGAVSHATESEDPFLSRLADDLRAIYQLLSQAMEAERKKSIEMKKKAITAQGKILKRLTEHYKVEKGTEEE